LWTRRIAAATPIRANPRETALHCPPVPRKMPAG
jgi:hypothetical protein